MTRATTHVFIPDLQAPYHDPKFVENLLDFVADYGPNTLNFVGDHFDQPEPARWNKGYAAEFAGTFWKGIEAGQKILGDFREVHAGQFRVKSGNHDERIETYVNRYAPALDSMPSLRMESLFLCDELDIDLCRKITPVAPGWLMAHGHEGGYSRVAGGTALGLARRTGFSVVCGHTHKVGLISESHGYQGKVQTLTGLEVGHGMAITKAHYLKTGAANWQQGLGILTVIGKRVYPQAITASSDGSFVVDGKEYGKRAA